MRKSIKKLIFFLIFGIILTEVLSAAPLKSETNFIIENAIEIFGREGAHFQGRVIRVESFSNNATAVRENALIRATWEIDQLDYEYFMILSENNSTLRTTYTTSGYASTHNIGGRIYTTYSPGSVRTNYNHSVILIILCLSADDINLLPDNTIIFSVITRLSQAQQIIIQENKAGLYFDTGYLLGLGMSLNNHQDFTWRLAELKAGYGPINNKPIYLVGEFISSINSLSEEKLFFFPLYIGGGILYYPVHFFQLGFSLGIHCPLNNGLYGVYEDNEWQRNFNWNINTGFSWNISAAFDLSTVRNNGWLFGLQYSWAINDYNVPDLNINSTITSSYLGIILKYTYRKKTPN